jgi:hypothetical protein
MLESGDQFRPRWPKLGKLMDDSEDRGGSVSRYSVSVPISGFPAG